MVTAIPDIRFDVSQILLLTTISGLVWFSLLTIYYAVLAKKRAVASMIASFWVAGVVTLWITAILLALLGVYNFVTGGRLRLSWVMLSNTVEAAYIISVGFLTVLFLFNQWSMWRMFRRYESLTNDEVTRLIERKVDVESLVKRFNIGDMKILAVDDIEVGAHTMVLAKPSLLKPALGKDVMVIKSPLVKILEPDELEGVLAHELAHIEALDDRFRPYFEVLGYVFFFDPVLQTIKNTVRRYQELGADDRAVEVTGKPKSLARALVKIAEHEYNVSGMTFDVKERIERLVSMDKGKVGQEGST